MKKIIAVALIAVFCLSLTACGDEGVDMSKFPKKFEQWTEDDVMNYFVAAGVFDQENARFKHDKEYYTGTPVSGCVGYLTKDTESYVSIWYVNESEEGGDEFLEACRKDKTLGEDLEDMELDHMVGRFLVSYGMSADSDYVKKMEAAWQQFLKDTKATPDF